jgi:hypothetical protein
MIQRCYRKWKDRTAAKESSILGKHYESRAMRKLRQSMIIMNPDGPKLFQQRQEASKIITNFLYSVQKNWKNFALNYLR